jgi:RNA polymerase sigma-70 factor (ECF subfamily)
VLGRFARSRPEELGRVYRENVASVFAFFAYSLNRPAAEDLTSQTFERVVRSWSSYDASRASERTWILAIARNILTDHHRRQSHRATVSTDEHPVLLDQLVDHDVRIEGGPGRDELRTWLALLGEREREILGLRYAADLPAAEIAEIVGLTAANVHQILSRSLRRLREHAEVREGPTDSA